MTDLNESTINYGIPIESKAPLFETVDVDKNDIKLSNLLDNYKGVLLDFFRGNW